MWETWVQSLGWEDPLEGHGNPFQYSSLENPMDRGAWWATVPVAESDTTEQLRQHRTWAYFWVLYSVSLIYCTCFMPTK